VRGRNGPFEEDADERDEVESSDRRDAFLDSRSIICLLTADLSSLFAYVSSRSCYHSYCSPVAQLRCSSSTRLLSPTIFSHPRSPFPVSPTSLERRHTFFCNRITDVHFFSSNPTHFAFPSLGSKSSVSVSRRRDSYVSCRPEACR
jgi:hypothetical protein